MAKTNGGLVEYCKAQIGRPYWYGTFGNTASASLYEAKKKQYPNKYTAKDYASQYGQRVHDCAGLIKGYLWSATPDSPPKYNAKEDYGATAFYQHCDKKGTIASFDRVPGRLLFKGTPSKMTHVGVWDGEKIIEAKGHAYGVVVSNLDSKWTHWGQCNLITEDQAPAPTPTPTPTPAPTPAPSYPKYKVKTNTGVPLRLRAAPTTKSVTLALIPNGTIITVTDTSGNWARTTYGGHTGWCSMTYLKKV